MKREEFVKAVTELVEKYIGDFYDYDGNAQLRVNPELLLVEIENGYAFQEDIGYSDEVIEDAAYAEGDETMSSTDYQARQNYDYYPVKDFIIVEADKTGKPDAKAIARLADKYFG